MMNRKLGKAAAAILALLAVSEAGSAAYFYRRTMKRNKVKVERTVKMAGTDWSRYMELIGERKAYMMAQPHEDVYVTSFDGLKLHGTYFPGKEPKTVICFHGYTSEGLKDYIGLSDYYMKNGFGMLLVDERAHGQSEGVIEAEIFPDYEYVKKQEITDVREALQKVIDAYNKTAAPHKKVYRLKIRETEFVKTPSKKIKRF